MQMTPFSSNYYPFQMPHSPMQVPAPMNVYSQQPPVQQQWQPVPQSTGAYLPYQGINAYPVGGKAANNQNYQQSQSDSHFLFQNPLEGGGGYNPFVTQPQNLQGMNQFMPFNPYPKKGQLAKQPGPMHSVLSSFKSQDGSFDINKMVNTAGQLVNTVSQASALIKGIGGVFKV